MGLERQASPGDVSPPPRDLIHSIGMSDAVNPAPNNTQIAAAPSRCSNAWSIERIARLLTAFLAIGLAGLLAAAVTPAAAAIVRDGDRLVFTGDILPGDDTVFAAALDGDVPKAAATAITTVVLGS